MHRTIAKALAATFVVVWTSMAFAQSVPLQAGPWTPGHAPMYSNSGNSQPVIQDSGSAAGGVAGATLSELGVTVRGNGTPPYANGGDGPNGENVCDYDAPIDNATGYHYLCMSPNAQGGGLLSYGAGGVAAALPFNMIINGVTYPFPGTGSGDVTGPASSTSGDVAVFGNTTGKLISDGGKGLPQGDIVGTTDAQTLTNKSIGGNEINSGTVGAGFGGTGASSLAAHNVVIGNGTSPVSLAAPGASGQVLASTGTTTDPAFTSNLSLPGNLSVGGTLTVPTLGTQACLGTTSGVLGVGICGGSSLANIAALEAVTAPSSGETVSVLGSQGGTFNFIAGGSCTSDGGTTFCANDATPGHWLRQFSGNVYSLAWFGVVGDGSTDDTTALQNAINAVPTGGTLNVPAASTCYKQTAALTVTKSIVVQGIGPQSQLCQATTGVDGIDITSSNVTITGLFVKGPQYATFDTNQKGIYATGTFNPGSAPTYISNITINNDTIENWGGYALGLNDVRNFSFNNNTVANIDYAGFLGTSVLYGSVGYNNISNIVGGPSGTPSGNAYGVTISRLTSDSGELTSQPYSQWVTVNNNIINGVETWECLDTHAGQHVTFANNVCYDVADGLVAGPSKNSAGTATYGPAEVSVSGNTFNSGVTDGSRTYGISLTGASGSYATGSSIVGNVVNGFGSDASATVGAVNIGYTIGVSVTGNTILYPAVIGISINSVNEGDVFGSDEIIDPWSNNQTVVWAIRNTGTSSIMSFDNIEAYHINKIATVVLTSANGEGVDFGTDTSSFYSLGTLHTNATTPINHEFSSPVQALLGAPVITMPHIPTSGTAAGSACIDSSGNVFEKKTTGSCL
jgi:hypothetical protein